MNTTQDATVSNPAPAALAMATVTTDSGTVAIICEPINEWLAITPVFGMDSDRKTWLDGTFRITHLASGLDFGDGSACIECCRAAGKTLTALLVDWSALTATNGAEWTAALDKDTQFALGTARQIEWACDAEYCDEADDAPESETGSKS